MSNSEDISFASLLECSELRSSGIMVAPGEAKRNLEYVAGRNSSQ